MGKSSSLTRDGGRTRGMELLEVEDHYGGTLLYLSTLGLRRGWIAGVRGLEWRI